MENMKHLIFTEPPTRLEIQDMSQSHPISDQQIPSPAELESSRSVQNDITYMGPYIEGQNVTVVCTAFGGKNFERLETSGHPLERSLSTPLKIVYKDSIQTIIETV